VIALVSIQAYAKIEQSGAKVIRKREAQTANVCETNEAVDDNKIYQWCYSDSQYERVCWITNAHLHDIKAIFIDSFGIRLLVRNEIFN